MNFKEALIAHLQGERVECRYKGGDWLRFEHDFGTVTIGRFNDYFVDNRFDFRLAPRTIRVNDVEVPAPESAAPKKGQTYYIPTPDTEELWSERWDHCEDTTARHMERGLVYLNKEDAIARAKAMLLTQQ